MPWEREWEVGEDLRGVFEMDEIGGFGNSMQCLSSLWGNVWFNGSKSRYHRQKVRSREVAVLSAKACLKLSLFQAHKAWDRQFMIINSRLPVL